MRCLGCLFAWLTFLGAGGSPVVSAISGPDQGGVALDLIVGLVIIFAIASFLLPLLLDFGLLEFVGALLTRFMRPLFQALGVPDAAAASTTMIVGFTDMFTPSVIIAAADVSAQTRFIVAVISVTQVLFLDEVGGLILASKLPVNLPELFVIFLERTIISLFIVCPVSHLLF